MSKIDNHPRHAYMIMCHDNFQHLCRLLSELDDERNDFYIHIDKKCRSYPYKEICNSVIKGSLHFVKRVSVNWGGYSQVYAELVLLEAATKDQHAYYHLISGVDYPLKSQNYIHQFFVEHQGSEFIRFDPNMSENEIEDRMRYYYFFQNKVGRNRGKFVALCYVVQQNLVSFQKRIHINRTHWFHNKIYKGVNWFSVTHDLALYILKRKKIIKRLCRYSFCADEIFVQTIAMLSPYRENIINNSLRYIDWKRGNPYVFTLYDYEELINTKCLFARKFDEKISIEIVHELHANILNA